mmetsp:Transcript_15917/g.41133  ORF Transcript_15917/g.41133 Transcript_15917/m.41133 type:complete len:243 (+) Transcript_15917:67-795(+)
MLTSCGRAGDGRRALRNKPLLAHPAIPRLLASCERVAASPSCHAHLTGLGGGRPHAGHLVANLEERCQAPEPAPGLPRRGQGFGAAGGPAQGPGWHAPSAPRPSQGGLQRSPDRGPPAPCFGTRGGRGGLAQGRLEGRQVAEVSLHEVDVHPASSVLPIARAAAAAATAGAPCGHARDERPAGGGRDCRKVREAAFRDAGAQLAPRGVGMRFAEARRHLLASRRLACNPPVRQHLGGTGAPS